MRRLRLSGARPPSLAPAGGNSHRIRAQTPVCPRREQNDGGPGWVQADTVRHSGPSPEGGYVCTLTCVDEVTGWIALRVLPRPGGYEVTSALERMHRTWPVPMAHLHTDNGAEFMNRDVQLWAERNGVRRSRGRPYCPTDQARAEERNGHVVRKNAGRARFEGAADATVPGVLCAALCDLHNFCIPRQRSTVERREDGRPVRGGPCGKPMTPCAPPAGIGCAGRGSSPSAAICSTPMS